MQRGLFVSKGLRLVVLIALCLAGGCTHSREMLVFDTPPPGTVPREGSPVSLPPYVIQPPDIVIIDVARKSGAEQAIALPHQPIQGQFTVSSDGTVRLGIWGSVQISGLTVDQARDTILRHIAGQTGLLGQIQPDTLLVSVDVAAYNSKKYYVITDGAGYGVQAFQFPHTGNEFVLDALSQSPINGIPPVGSQKLIWVARRHPGTCNRDQLLKVEWERITQCGDMSTNYQIMPGDRVYVMSEQIFRTQNFLQKYLAPIERILGAALLGATFSNAVSNNNNNVFNN